MNAAGRHAAPFVTRCRCQFVYTNWLNAMAMAAVAVVGDVQPWYRSCDRCCSRFTRTNSNAINSSNRPQCHHDSSSFSSGRAASIALLL